jgi:hypothetical protein
MTDEDQRWRDERWHGPDIERLASSTATMEDKPRFSCTIGDELCLSCWSAVDMIATRLKISAREAQKKLADWHASGEIEAVPINPPGTSKPPESKTESLEQLVYNEADLAHLLDQQAPPEQAELVTKPACKPGVYDEADRALFSDLERIMREKYLRPHGAAVELGSKIAGRGTSENKAKRLANLYLRERGANQSAD